MKPLGVLIRYEIKYKVWEQIGVKINNKVRDQFPNSPWYLVSGQNASHAIWKIRDSLYEAN